LTLGFGARYHPGRGSRPSRRREKGLDPGDRRPPLNSNREFAALAGLLLLTFGLRAIGADQPIVENYVGRQIPTAMVARNLDRGSGFLRPQVDTAPFPNLFLVEPPLEPAAVLGLCRMSGFGLERSGRLVSALATALAAWGLYGLARRREGVAVALLAVAAFALFPLTLRYGRAFQPDAMMLGGVLVGLRCWDEYESGNGRGWLVLGWLALATGFALKVVWASALIPLVAVVLRPRQGWKAALALATVLPALLWYVHAAVLLAEGGGSKASGDNGAIWLSVLVPSALLRMTTWTSAAWVTGVRAFTPVGAAMAVWGLSRLRGGDRLWTVWGTSTLITLGVLAGKLHHEYYWLSLAPVVAVEFARGLMDLSARGTWGARLAVALGGVAVGLSGFQSSNTWRTPLEWTTLPAAAEAVRAHVPADAWVVAPEALLFASDRRGCRLEFSRGSVLRAAGEWGETLPGDDAFALVEFYRGRGARFFADVGTAQPARLALHEAIRRRYKILVDRPGVLVAALVEYGEP